MSLTREYHLKRMLRAANYCISQIADPRQAITGIRNIMPFVDDWRQYSQLPDAEPLRWLDIRPQLHDRTSRTPYDPHYFFLSGWAARRITTHHPRLHVDIGAHNLFATVLAATVPTVFVDYRPLNVDVGGLYCTGGDILRLPFADDSLESLSCLHVAEHIGLGRYGDPLNPEGTRLAIAELMRVLAPGGYLYFALPVGLERVCFNAHRIHKASTIRSFFASLELVEFSGVDDCGRYCEQIEFMSLDSSEYACGFFLLRKPA